MKILKNLVLLFMPSMVLATDIDRQLHRYINEFKLEAINERPIDNQALFDLGKELYFEKEWSGNKNISCADCHHPKFQTVDWLPFSLGEGAEGDHLNRQFKQGLPTRRSTPHLFNQDLHQVQFWDGRVEFKKGKFSSPLEKELEFLLEPMTHAASLQALFPLLDPIEMLGTYNELARATRVELVDLLYARIVEGPRRHYYQQQIYEAFPGVHNTHLGHLIEALGYFQRFAFQIYDSPWDEYLRGNQKALDQQEKAGALLFLTKGQCIQCHTGSTLGGDSFHNNGTPFLTINGDDDYGRFEVTQKEEDRYRYKTPSLRSVAFTFPYMHNGYFMTLEQVLEHYSSPEASYRNQLITQILESVFDDNYPGFFWLEEQRSREILSTLSPLMPRESLTKDEQEKIIKFLRHGLASESSYYVHEYGDR